MGYSPLFFYTSPQDSAHGATGPLVLSLTSTPAEYDVLILCMEMRGGDTPPTYTGWTLLGSVQTGSGATNAKAAVYLHRYDGATLPSLSFSLTTIDHASLSLHLISGVDRDMALGDIVYGTTTDATADNTQKSQNTSPTNAGITADDAQRIGVLFFTAGGDNHGGSTVTIPITSSKWYNARNSMKLGHVSGVDGSHFVSLARADDPDAENIQFSYSTSNSMKEARMTVFFPAHTTTDFTRSVSDGLGASDSTGRLAAFTRGVSNALGFSESINSTLTALGEYAFGVSDALGLTDAVSRLAGYSRAVADSLGTSELIAHLVYKYRAVADSLSFSESVQHLVAGIPAVLGEPADVDKEIYATTELTDAIYETASWGDEVYSTTDLKDAINEQE